MKTHLEELLSGYVDDQLDAAQRARVESHLAACGECRAELAGLRQLKTTLGEVAFARPMEMTPEFFWSQVRRRIEQEDARATAGTGGGSIWGAVLWRRLAVAAAAALVVVGVGIVLFRGGSPTPTPTQSFVEIDEASTQVTNGEVSVSSVGGATVIAMPESYVEVDEVRTEVPNAAVSAFQSPKTGDTVIWISGLKEEGGDPRGM